MPPAIVRKSEVARDPFDQIEEFLEHETQNRRMAQLLEKFREQKSKEAI